MEFNESEQNKSLDANREGIRRSLALFKHNPVGGVGTKGYEAVAKHFAIPGTEGSLANQVALCHYAQTLAEEGLGALIYFLFLFAYLIETLMGLKKSKSRFQFIAAVSLFSAVLMVLFHAGISQLMQRFAISLLVYILMGSSLAVVSKDFEGD